jgi:hypothetical protein
MLTVFVDPRRLVASTAKFRITSITFGEGETYPLIRSVVHCALPARIEIIKHIFLCGVTRPPPSAILVTEYVAAFCFLCVQFITHRTASRPQVP